MKATPRVIWYIINLRSCEESCTDGSLIKEDKSPSINSNTILLVRMRMIKIYRYKGVLILESLEINF